MVIVNSKCFPHFETFDGPSLAFMKKTVFLRIVNKKIVFVHTQCILPTDSQNSDLKGNC